MAKLADILPIERDRQEPDKWNVIHLFKTGTFYSAYEWSAWLTAVIAFNDEVRMQTRERQPLSVTRNTIASSEGETFCKVGFPIKSVDKFIPNRMDFQPIDDSHLTITIAMPTPPDGSEMTYERLSEAFEQWKESQPIKKPKEKEETTDDQKPATATRSTQTRPSATIAPSPSGLISQIMAYPLDQRTPLENIEFISSLKQQIAGIL
jgi:hypothetical protein